ncbi:MAG: hypothetical protein R3Y05_04555 [bacterium]
MNFKFDKENLKYIYITLSLFFLLISTNLVRVFHFLYNAINYGLFNEIFRLSLSFFYLVIGLLIVVKIFKIKLPQKKELLSIKRVLILYAVALVPIVIMSAALGWEVKIFFDIQDNSTGGSIIEHFINIAVCIPKLFIVTLIIHYSQLFFEKSITFNKENLIKFIPFGGIIALLTFGLFELIFGVHHFNIFYLLINIYFGFIYLLTNKSVPKSYIIILLIYLL